MATITGLTAARMLAIEAAATVDAEVVGEDLIITRNDGTTFNAGRVRGVEGPTGPAGLSLSPLATTPVRDVGEAGQIRAGRQLTVADFTTLCGLPTIPVGLFNLSDVSNLGTGPALINKGSTANMFRHGINGLDLTAVDFFADTAKGLYIADTGGGDPFRLRSGSWGCWVRVDRRGVSQVIMSKDGSSGNFSYLLYINGSNETTLQLSVDGTGVISLYGPSIADGQWHFVVTTFDNTTARLYIDTVLTASALYAGLLFPSSAPFNIGSKSLDATNIGTLPLYGKIDEAFVTPDILSEEQIRLLYCAKLPHGRSAVPKQIVLNARRRKRGAILAPSDFPLIDGAGVLRLYNLNNLSDLGTNNVPLTGNQGSGFIGYAQGPLGEKDGARYYNGAHAGDSGTDAGLPTATARRIYGVWLKTNQKADAGVISWGSGAGTTSHCLYVNSAGVLVGRSPGVGDIGGIFVADGEWHQCVMVETSAYGSNVRRWMYVDGKLVAVAADFGTITLAGANKFRLGAWADGSNPFSGVLARAFVAQESYSIQQIAALFNKGSQEMGLSPKNPGDHIEAFDATNLYATFDSLPAQHQIDLAVAV